MNQTTPDPALSEFALKYTVDIVSAYIGRSTLKADELPVLLQSVYDSLNRTGSLQPIAKKQLVPAVPIKKSITPGYLICLEDGKKVKMLKRYLRTSYGLSPQEYRIRWGLPPDYPMAAPDYTAARSTFALKTGFGRKKGAKPRRRVG